MRSCQSLAVDKLRFDVLAQLVTALHLDFVACRYVPSVPVYMTMSIAQILLVTSFAQVIDSWMVVWPELGHVMEPNILVR